jgi:hypothetical protein
MWHGSTHIAGLYPDRLVAQDFLTYGADLVDGLGFSTIKLELSIAYNTNKYPGQLWPGGITTLSGIVAAPAMATVINQFDRIWFSVFSLVQSTDNLWGQQWTQTRGNDIETEFYNMCVYLLTNYSNKEFIVSNWEGDWQLLQGFNASSAIKRSTLYGYRDFQRRRFRAVKAARAAVPASTSTIKFAIEVNRVLDGWGPRLDTDVLENVGADIVGLSMYEAIEGWLYGLTQAQFLADIETKMTKIITDVRKYHSGDIVISEFGWPIDDPTFVAGSYDVDALLQKVLDVAEAQGVVGEIYWQILDNEQQSPGVPRGFCLYSRDGNSTTVGALNTVGQFYQALLAS